MSSCAAQPQCSMKEPPAALLLRHEIDRPACASSASSESGSLELLLILHALVGATICGAQTNRSAQVERATRCSRRQDGDMRTPRGRVPVKVAVSCAAGPAQRRCIRAPGDFHQYPVGGPACRVESLVEKDKNPEEWWPWKLDPRNGHCATPSQWSRRKSREISGIVTENTRF